MPLSRKQEIYRDILALSLPHMRNGLSNVVHVFWWTILPRRRRRFARSYYEVAELVHGLSDTIFCADFTEQDFWFLNVHARAFLERNAPKNITPYPVLALHIQQLFAAVPDELRHKLNWPGPTEDWSWVIINQEEKEKMVARLFPRTNRNDGDESAGGE